MDNLSPVVIHSPVAMLQGMQGRVGSPGLTGQAGPKGEPGKNGIAGLNGVKGIQVSNIILLDLRIHFNDMLQLAIFFINLELSSQDCNIEWKIESLCHLVE